jgi:hypothetical protein
MPGGPAPALFAIVTSSSTTKAPPPESASSALVSNSSASTSGVTMRYSVGVFVRTSACVKTSLPAASKPRTVTCGRLDGVPVAR